MAYGSDGKSGGKESAIREQTGVPFINKDQGAFGGGMPPEPTRVNRGNCRPTTGAPGAGEAKFKGSGD